MTDAEKVAVLLGACERALDAFRNRCDAAGLVALEDALTMCSKPPEIELTGGKGISKYDTPNWIKSGRHA